MTIIKIKRIWGMNCVAGDTYAQQSANPSATANAVILGNAFACAMPLPLISR